MNKNKLLSIPLFMLSIVVAVSQVLNILSFTARTKKIDTPSYSAGYTIGYFSVCLLLIALSYWLFRKASQLWNKDE